MRKNKSLKTFLMAAALFLALPVLVFASTAPAAESPSLTHRMMYLALQLGLIFFAAKLGNVIMTRLKMPGVLGELMAGMIIGPHLLGGIAFYGFPHGVFPMGEGFAISPELYAFGTIASIVLLFMTGLETDLKMFLKYSVAGTMVGVGGVIFSFVAGDLTAVFLSGLISDVPLTFMSPPALFLGVISTATSVGITARILSERKYIEAPEGVTILSGAVVDDVLGIVMLALVIGIANAGTQTGAIDWVRIGIVAGKTVGIWLVGTALCLFLASRIGKFLKVFKKNSTIAIMALGLALIVAGFFEEAGLAMIIGAYVMGLSISQTDLKLVVQEKLHLIGELMIPVFFCVMGMLVNFHEILAPKLLLFGLVYTVFAIISKIIGCGIPSLATGFNLRGAIRVGVGMVPRGEVALIVAGIGHSTGFLGNEVFGVAIIMTLITTLTAPPLLSGILNAKKGVRKDKQLAARKEVPYRFPTPFLTDLVTEKVLALFKGEGFYTHLIDHDAQVYQFLKERMILAMRKENDGIVFDIPEESEALIHTAMYTVLHEIEVTVRGLQTPFDKKEIARRMQETSSTMKTGESDLTGFLKFNRISNDLKGETKEEIVRELIEILARAGDIKDSEAVFEAVMAREASMSTGLQDGVALPHAKTDLVDGLVCAMGIRKGGVDYQSLDGKLSEFFFITLSPKTRPAPHMQFMAAVSRALSVPGIKDKLRTADSITAVWHLLSGKNG
jgi:Kef-type K+ transport system membrane component KefB/mannitol/fructose-specific phosphotransferase system IIA component (Ntr-type)